jgi:signal transduction histidine kinase
VPTTGRAAGVRTTTVDLPDSRTSSSAIDLQERERARIGFDLHDGPAQSMSAALLQVRLLEDLQPQDYPVALEELRATIDVALREMYDIIHDLASRQADDMGFTETVESVSQRFIDRSGVAAEVVVTGDPTSASRSLQIALFRIVQESLCNVRRHAQARHVAITVKFTNTEALCAVVDDGIGFDAGRLSEEMGRREPFGLYGMAERAKLLGGECSVTSKPGAGTRVAVRIPLWQS